MPGTGGAVLSLFLRAAPVIGSHEKSLVFTGGPCALQPRMLL